MLFHRRTQLSRQIPKKLLTEVQSARVQLRKAGEGVGGLLSGRALGSVLSSGGKEQLSELICLPMSQNWYTEGLEPRQSGVSTFSNTEGFANYHYYGIASLIMSKLTLTGSRV